SADDEVACIPGDVAFNAAVAVAESGVPERFHDAVLSGKSFSAEAVASLNRESAELDCDDVVMDFRFKEDYPGLVAGEAPALTQSDAAASMGERSRGSADLPWTCLDGRGGEFVRPGSLASGSNPAATDVTAADTGEGSSLLIQAG
ncbi:unnamed protein product, partial [Symbiodinium sp. KB8]